MGLNHSPYGADIDFIAEFGHICTYLLLLIALIDTL
jgi:hypothetical protein